MSPEKRLKDPFRPKRPRSSFINFYLNNIDEILKDNPVLNLVKHNRMVQIASEWWKDENQHVTEKNEAKRQAHEDLEHYRELMEKYEPPTQEELKRRLKERPKRFRTNWNFYVQDKFAEVYKKFHDFGRVVSYLANKWKELSEAARIRYDVMYEEDRIRYAEEMEVYIAKYKVE